MTKNSRHITITMPVWLQKTLDEYVASIPVVPGTKRSVSSYACNAILERLKGDGAHIYTPSEVEEHETPAAITP